MPWKTRGSCEMKLFLSTLHGSLPFDFTSVAETAKTSYPTFLLRCWWLYNRWRYNPPDLFFLFGGEKIGMAFNRWDIGATWHGLHFGNLLKHFPPWFRNCRRVPLHLFPVLVLPLFPVSIIPEHLLGLGLFTFFLFLMNPKFSWYRSIDIYYPQQGVVRPPALGRPRCAVLGQLSSTSLSTNSVCWGSLFFYGFEFLWFR